MKTSRKFSEKYVRGAKEQSQNLGTLNHIEENTVFKDKICFKITL